MTPTPGPWSVRPDGVTIKGKGSLYVADCRVSSCYRSDEETRANARLIAKAPVMYDMLVELAFMLKCEEESVRKEHAKLIKRLEKLMALLPSRDTGSHHDHF